LRERSSRIAGVTSRYGSAPRREDPAFLVCGRIVGRIFLRANPLRSFVLGSSHTGLLLPTVRGGSLLRRLRDLQRPIYSISPPHAAANLSPQSSSSRPREAKSGRATSRTNQESRRRGWSRRGGHPLMHKLAAPPGAFGSFAGRKNTSRNRQATRNPRKSPLSVIRCRGCQLSPSRGASLYAHESNVMEPAGTPLSRSSSPPHAAANLSPQSRSSRPREAKSGRAHSRTTQELRRRGWSRRGGHPLMLKLAAPPGAFGSFAGRKNTSRNKQAAKKPREPPSQSSANADASSPPHGGEPLLALSLPDHPLSMLTCLTLHVIIKRRYIPIFCRRTR